MIYAVYGPVIYIHCPPPVPTPTPATAKSRDNDLPFVITLLDIPQYLDSWIVKAQLFFPIPTPKNKNWVNIKSY